MEELKQLKAKHVKTSKSIFENVLQSLSENVDEIKRNQDQEFDKDESKIKELTSLLATLKETQCTETQLLQCKNNDLLKYNNDLKQLETENKKLSQEIKQLEEKQNNLKSSKPNLQDQQVLEQGKKKLKLYRNLVRIHWDYETTDHSTEGYVTNKHNYLHHFCYKNQDVNDKLIDSLWNEIYLSTDKAIVEDKNL